MGFIIVFRMLNNAQNHTEGLGVCQMRTEMDGAAKAENMSKLPVEVLGQAERDEAERATEKRWLDPVGTGGIAKIPAGFECDLDGGTAGTQSRNLSDLRVPVVQGAERWEMRIVMLALAAMFVLAGGLLAVLGDNRELHTAQGLAMIAAFFVCVYLSLDGK